MPTIAHIEALTKQYAERRQKLNEAVANLQADIQAAKKYALPKIKHYVASAMEAQSVLAAAIDAARELFDRPRSAVFSGIKVGLHRAPGRVEWEDASQVVDLIRKRLPGDFDRLVKVTYTPVKSAIVGLSAPDLARIGCTVADTGDVVLIKPADGEVDRLVDALLKDHLTEVEQQ